MSVDLVGSTAFKSQHRGEPSARWANVFTEFYFGLPKMFQRRLGGETLPENLQPKLLKTLGDEVLLHVVICGHRDAQQVVEFFRLALAEYQSKNLSDKPLKLKGAAWIAGFPINNHPVPFEDGSNRQTHEDFIGPSMDAGFRIAKFSSPHRMMVSVDLALLLLEGGRGVEVYFDGVEPMRGVLDGRPYPKLWCLVGGESNELAKMEIKLRGVTAGGEPLRDYCREFIRTLPPRTWLIVPYFAGDDVFGEVPDWHETVSATNQRIDENNASDGERPEPAA